MFDQQKNGHCFKKKSECCKTLTDCHIFDVGKKYSQKHSRFIDRKFTYTYDRYHAIDNS